MHLSAFPDGGRLFVDANIFLYHFWDRSDSCSQLFSRMEVGLIRGITSTTVLGEVAHQLLVGEALTRYPDIARHPIRSLKRRPSLIRNLSDAWRLLDRLTHLPLRVISLTPRLWHQSVTISRETGLLMNDATTVACLRRLHLRHLASNDRDFLRVSGLTVWRP